MRRTTLLISLLFVLTAGKLGRLSDAELDHWRALRIFVEDRDQRAWLKLKTEEDRNAWLRERGLWDRFYKFDEETRDEIVAGDIERGWSRDQVYMAWGHPFEKLRLTGREAGRSETLVYRFEVDKKGYATPLVGAHLNHKAVDRYQVEVIVDDNVISEIIEKDDWE